MQISLHLGGSGSQHSSASAVSRLVDERFRHLGVDCRLGGVLYRCFSVVVGDLWFFVIHIECMMILSSEE